MESLPHGVDVERHVQHALLLCHLVGDVADFFGQDFDHHHLSTAMMIEMDTPLVDITSMDEDALDRIRVYWAVVFQHNALFSGTVYDNIALWLREIKRMDDTQIQPIALHIVEAVGLEPDEVLRLDRDKLSGGMAKRIAMARALAMDPKLLYYDEPTTGLDPYNSALIQDLIVQTHERPRQDRERRTSIIVTHDKDVLRRLRPRVVMLHDGVVYFDGPFDDFEASASSIIRPYLDLMPILHRQVRYNEDKR